MTTRAEALLEQALHLAPEERARIAARLLESLEGLAADDEYEKRWAAEISARLRELDAGSVETVDWECVRREAARLASR